MTAGVSPVKAEAVVLRPASPDGSSITSVTRFVIDPDEAFTGHYSGLPLFPGVCVIECAHRGSMATMPQPESGPVPPVRLVGLKSARFRVPVSAMS